eukprot:11689196-Ditylum_brightwellii.AAC.1
MRSEGTSTSPSSNATVNNAIIEETNSEQEAIEHNIREPDGKPPPRTQAVPMQPSKEARQILEDYRPQPYTPSPCQPDPPQKDFRGKVPRKRLPTRCHRET